MSSRFSSEELRAIRNEIPLRELIVQILRIPSKMTEGVFRFLCPKCGEFQTAINERTNLSRCFRCKMNLNAIELVMRERHLCFVDSVKLLKQLLITRQENQLGATVSDSELKIKHMNREERGITTGQVDMRSLLIRQIRSLEIVDSGH